MIRESERVLFNPDEEKKMSVKQVLMSATAVAALVLGGMAHAGEAEEAADVAKEHAYEAAAEADAAKVAADEAAEQAKATESAQALEAAAFAESEESGDVAEAKAEVGDSSK